MGYTGFGSNNHYNPDEPRDWHGRWTTVGSSAIIDDLSDLGRADAALTFLDRELNNRGLRGSNTETRARSLARLMKPWIASAHLTGDEFYRAFMPVGTGKQNAPLVRDAVVKITRAEFLDDIEDAAGQLADFTQKIGPQDWPRFLKIASGRLELEHAGLTNDIEETPTRSATIDEPFVVRETSAKVPTAKVKKKSKEDQADDLRKLLKSKDDPFAAYAFPIILYAEGGFVRTGSNAVAGIMLDPSNDTHAELLGCSSVRKKDHDIIQNNPVPTPNTVAAYYRAYIDYAMRRINAEGGKHGYELLNDVKNGITDMHARLAFVDVLFAIGQGKGPSIIHEAISRTLADKGQSWKNDESGVLKNGTFDEFRELANNPETRTILIENLENLVTGQSGYGGRKSNIYDYLRHIGES